MNIPVIARNPAEIERYGRAPAMSGIYPNKIAVPAAIKEYMICVLKWPLTEEFVIADEIMKLRDRGELVSPKQAPDSTDAIVA